MSGLGLALCALVLAGAVRADLTWFAWATVPLLLLVHDATYGMLRTASRHRMQAPTLDGTDVHARGPAEPPQRDQLTAVAAPPDMDPVHALPALIMTTVLASACAILQSPAATSTSTVAPVIAWLVPVLLMGAPPSAAPAWLARQASFCAVTALAALAATQHAHVDVVMQFFGACLAAGLAKVVFAAARTPPPGSRTPNSPDP